MRNSIPIMRNSTAIVALSLALALAAHNALAVEPVGEAGRVQLPLEIYNQLVQAGEPTDPAPAGFALGRADLNLRVNENNGRASAEVDVTLGIEVLEDRWVLVPILPAGSSVASVSIDGKPVQLINTPGGLAWGSRQSGSYSMTLRYRVDATRSPAGFVLPVPTPEAAATQLVANLPGPDLAVAVIPAAGVETQTQGQLTRLSASVPATRGLQISWAAPALEGHSLSRALYSGSLVGEAIRWTADLFVELAGNEAVTLPLLPANVTLSDILVDGEQASILVADGHFATVLRGRGPHQLRVSFEVPVQQSDGPPRVSLRLPEIPVSRFELTLPGRKELTASPATDVAHESSDQSTIASFHVPMTRQLELSWTEAIPGDLRTETRAHASAYHAVHAEEGVLYVDALLALEVNRGELSSLELELPADVQVNRVSSENGGISDWRITAGGGDEPQRVVVFLGHPLSGEMRLRVHYDRSLGRDGARIPIPLLRAREVHRQRGMVALLATSDVSLTPLTEANLTRVGENQLPPFFRRTIDQTIAHTFKYAETAPSLVAEATAPERVLAKFDAEVDTLISLTDVTLRGSASVNINVKSGKLTALELLLPPDVNLLNLTGPSLRTHRLGDADDRIVTVEFTQDMEGQFRLEVAYERITTDAESELSVPTLSVVGAEVEQGRIAVEALAAVEVQVARAAQLSSLDPSELPQQLILKTTNPILLAYKYVHVDPPYQLALRMTRHREMDVQTAAIDTAEYRTLFTADGLAVTTARFSVRNSRKQFLRVRLPRNAELWSATVDGKPEKPADAGDGSDDPDMAPEILIKVINSVQGFPVEIIYTTPGSAMHSLGRMNAHLPRPDMVVTRSRWDLYMPDRFHYGTPTTNMDLVSNGSPVSREELEYQMSSLDRTRSGPRQLQPLQIEVPRSGIHFALEKLYANQADTDATVSIPYTSDFGATLGQAAALLGTALFWSGLWLAWRRDGIIAGPRAIALSACGLVLLLVPIGYLQTSPAPPLALSILGLLGVAAWIARERLGPVPAAPAAEGPAS